MNRFIQNKRAQSTLEYVIIWTAIVAAILITAKTALQPAVQETVEKVADKLSKDTARLIEDNSNN